MPKKSITTTLSFTADFQQTATEAFKPGAEVTILFDSNRLPYERSTNAKGKAEWTISAYTQFAPEGAVSEIKLAPQKGKNADTLKGVFTVPADSQEVTIWFLNTGTSGNLYFDSNFGKNYYFPIIAEFEEAPAKKARAKRA